MADEWEGEACDYINEAECEERLEERGISMAEAEEKHFQEEELKHADASDELESNEEIEDEDY